MALVCAARFGTIGAAGGKAATSRTGGRFYCRAWHWVCRVPRCTGYEPVFCRHVLAVGRWPRFCLGWRRRYDIRSPGRATQNRDLFFNSFSTACNSPISAGAQKEIYVLGPACAVRPIRWT